MERSNRNLWIGLGVLALLVVLAAWPGWGGGLLIGRGALGPFGFRPLIGTPWLWGMWGVGLLSHLLVWGVVLFLVIRLFRGAARGGDRDDPRAVGLTPEEILRRRYAAGEITREQYEETRRTLDSSNTGVVGGQITP